MTNQGWDLARVKKLRAAMTDFEIEALLERESADPKSLTTDEVGILFIVTREKIRTLEAKAGGSSGDAN